MIGNGVGVPTIPTLPVPLPTVPIPVPFAERHASCRADRADSSSRDDRADRSDPDNLARTGVIRRTARALQPASTRRARPLHRVVGFALDVDFESAGRVCEPVLSAPEFHCSAGRIFDPAVRFVGAVLGTSGAHASHDDDH